MKMKRLNFMFALIVCGLLSLPVTAQVGPKGEVKPTPAPATPPTNKNTSGKKGSSPRKGGSSSTPQRNSVPKNNEAAANERRFWESIRDSSNIEDFRAYLNKYPDGQFAEIAQNKIQGLVEAAESSFWENVKNSANPEELRTYLTKYPNGMYASAARNQIDALEKAARKEEALRKEEEAKKEEAKRKEEAEKKGASEVFRDPRYVVREQRASSIFRNQRPGEVVRSQMGMELVYVPAGSFMMGSENGRASETPVHQVIFSEGFYMGRYEVTQAQWKAVMGNNPSKFKGDNLPVENVSWNDAQEFVKKLNAQDDVIELNGYTYRLPTEAEWEYASRAGNSGDYATGSLEPGSVLLDAIAWYDENSGRKTHAVGTKRANAFGLYDMYGNVWELCEDVYKDSYNDAPSDGSAWKGRGGLMGSLEKKDRVLRGGSWYEPAATLRSAYRSHNTTDFRSGELGFRVVAVWSGFNRPQPKLVKPTQPKPVIRRQNDE